MFDAIRFENVYNDIFEAIRYEILYKFDSLKSKFNFTVNYKNEITKALIKFAKSDRKKLGIAKIMPRFQAQKTVNELLAKNFLTLEKSHEIKPRPARKNEKLPKELRRYVIHDKVHFKDNFSRFWFRFIKPNETLIKEQKFDEVMKIIKKDFDNYASLGFEILSMELLAKYLKTDKKYFSSFWNKEIEIDIYAKINDIIIVGECKYKERKICKNIYNLTIAKCQKANIVPTVIALFSKSGFSEELLNFQDPNLLLFELEDFKLLL